MVEEAVISLLKDLGLSNYEARVLYALFRLKEADAKQIAELADVPRTKIYEILEKLAAAGYVIVKDTRPRVYASKDPKAIIRRMINERWEHLEKIAKRAEQIGEILPVLSESGESRKNYIMKFREIDDFLAMLREELSENAIIFHTRESEYLFSRLGRKMVEADVDVIVDGKRVYLPLHPLHEPMREVTVMVFLEEPYVRIFERWADEHRRTSP